MQFPLLHGKARNDSIAFGHKLGTEIKPLVKFGIVIDTNLETHRTRVAAVDTLDVSAVEAAGYDHLPALNDCRPVRRARTV